MRLRSVRDCACSRSESLTANASTFVTGNPRPLLRFICKPSERERLAETGRPPDFSSFMLNVAYMIIPSTYYLLQMHALNPMQLQRHCTVKGPARVLPEVALLTMLRLTFLKTLTVVHVFHRP